MKCDRCLDDGFYFDAGCMENTCAHGGRTRSPQELKRLRKQEAKDASDDSRRAITIKARTGRVMNCPVRVCTCEASGPPREELKAKLRLQDRMITARHRRLA